MAELLTLHQLGKRFGDFAGQHMATSNIGPEFSFDPEKHLYILDGKVIPSCTQVLAAMGYDKGADFYTDNSRSCGNAVHHVCELIDQHCNGATCLEEVQEYIDIGEALIPYVNGYLLFRRETGYTPQLQEIPVYSRRLRVGGKFDSYGTYRDSRSVLVDRKTWKQQGSTPKRSAALQTALYAIMAKESLNLDTDLRVVLRLPGDNTYRAYECTDPNDSLLATYCCAVYWDRARHGLIG